MPRFTRDDILTRLRAKVDPGEAIVGGGAGTGLSAKCEEEGGIDLIVIYNSGRYRTRVAGRAAVLRQRQRRGHGHGQGGAAGRHGHPRAGRGQRDRPVLRPGGLPRRGVASRVLRRANLPTVELIVGSFRANLEATGMNYALEVEMIAAAHSKDLFTTPYVFSPEDAEAMTRAGSDVAVCHMG